MAPPTFDPDECPPQRTLWRKMLASDKSWSLEVPISSSNLRSKRQEEFIQASFCKEVPHQLWPSLDQDYVTLANTVHCHENVLGAECTSSALHSQDLYRWWETLFADARFAVGGSDDQDSNL